MLFIILINLRLLIIISDFSFQFLIISTKLQYDSSHFFNLLILILPIILLFLIHRRFFMGIQKFYFYQFHIQIVSNLIKLDLVITFLSVNCSLVINW
jgi:hypothetical protein